MNSFCFFFNDKATTEIYTYGHTLSLHDALPIYRGQRTLDAFAGPACRGASGVRQLVRRLRGGARPRQARRAAGVGGRAGQAGGAGEPTPRPVGARDLFRRARLALCLSLAATARGAHRGGFRRAWPTLAPDPRCVRGERGIG